MLSPVFVVTIVCLKFTGEGEAFYLQSRIGKDSKVFKLFKFATMLKDSPNMGSGTVTLKDDNRVLPVGKVLRKYKINELPQLINVFIGDVGLVGPRPQTPSCFDAFTTKQQAQIVTVRPGLSGIGPLVFRGEEDLLEGGDSVLDLYNNVIGPYKGDVELWYIANENLRTYFKIILATIWVVSVPRSNLVWTWFDDYRCRPPNCRTH